MEFFAEHIATILEFFCFTMIAKSLINHSLYPSLFDFGMLVCVVLSSAILHNYPIFFWLLGTILYFVYIFHLQKTTILNHIFLFILSYGSIILLNFLMYSCLSQFVDSNSFYFPILGNICTLLISFFLFRFTICGHLYHFLEQAKLPLKLLLINTFLLFFILLFFYKSNISYFMLTIVYWLVITIILLFANISILYYDRQLFRKHQELYSYEKNLPLYQTLIDEIRSNQHEFSNRLQHFQKLPYVCKDYDSLSEALLTYSNSYCKPLQNYALLQIDMPLLAATLYNFSCIASQKDITLAFNICSFHLISCAPEYQLADYVSILTQNAIEASKNGDHIYICISSSDGKVTFEIRNPFSHALTTTEIARFFKKEYTSKSTGSNLNGTPHGYGLYSLHQNITKQGGSIGAECIQHNERYWVLFKFTI